MHKIGKSLFLALSLVAADVDWLGAAPPARAASQVKLQVDGRTVPLRHAVAARYVDPQGKTEVKLLFASTPQPGLVLVDPFGEEDIRVPDQKTSLVILTFAAASPEQHSLRIVHQGQLTQTSGSSGVPVVNGLVLGTGTVAGSLDLGTDTHAIVGAFRAPLTTVESPRPLRGAAVASSAPAQALMAFARALAARDFAAAQRHSKRDVQATVAQAHKVALERLLEQYAPGPLAAQLSSPGVELLETPDRARIRITQEHRPGVTSSTSYRLSHVEGAWKVE